jgi:transcriptional regulator
MTFGLLNHRRIETTCLQELRMYVPKYYREEHKQKILEFIRENDFATLVVYDGEKPIAGHLLVEVMEGGDNVTILGHMSRANPLWKSFRDDNEVLVIFQGPHTYVSPTWYNHVNVPTWNYISVHAYGWAKVMTEHDEVYALLSRLVNRHETHSSYRLESLPQDFVEKEMKGIVAFRVDVTRLETAYKLSQNREDEDYQNIVIELEKRSDEMSHQVADAMRKNRLTISR